MPSARGGHKVKPAKTAQVDASTPSCTSGVPFVATKPTRRNTEWRASITKPGFLSRSFTETNLASPVLDGPPPVKEPSRQQGKTTDTPTRQPDITVDSIRTPMDFKCDKEHDAPSNGIPNELERSVRPTFSRNSSSQSSGLEDTYEAVSDTFDDLSIEETQSSASSTYSRDLSSIYASDSASIYSSASSIYSSGASMYSFDEETETTFDPRLPGGLQYQQRTRTVAARRQEPQDAASRERSSLARKAAMFKNSRLSPQLPLFSTSLSTWSMVCRAGQASLDCYDSQSRNRRGIYTPADTSKDIKAMIIDDQLIDNSRLVIVSIRGTECQSLADWSVNKAANPAKPVGFLDDEENACHAGFLQVAKAMIGQVAAQLQQHPASSERPSLLFTGHSAGGAVAAMLYSHMLSTCVQSDLTTLAGQFPSINCVTFGAPPLSLTPLPKRDHGSGVFLAFANEGDPILRLSNAAYVKSLAKLMTASPPSSATAATTAPTVKVVRHSRGTRIIRQTLPDAPPTPWEELPLWPTPPAPLTNAGEVILLRDNENGSAAASRVTPEDLREVIFGDLGQHTIEVYIRRVKDVAFAAMIGRDVN
ncbi:Nn.00g045050.m01.CDS01 [Neocucurbitaria sp. VM-36]